MTKASSMHSNKQKANTFLLLQVLFSSRALPPQQCSCHPMLQVESCPPFQQFCCQRPLLPPCHLRQVLGSSNRADGGWAGGGGGFSQTHGWGWGNRYHAMPTPRPMRARLALQTSCCRQPVSVQVNRWLDAVRHSTDLSCTLLFRGPLKPEQLVQYSMVESSRHFQCCLHKGGAIGVGGHS